MPVPFPETCPNGIPADSDVAGIGVRIAVYIQALISLWPCAIILSIPTLDELRLAESEPAMLKLLSRSASSLLSLAYTSLALFLAAIIKIAQHTLTPYHAVIIMNLSWLTIISTTANEVTVFLAVNAFSSHVFNANHDSAREISRIISQPRPRTLREEVQLVVADVRSSFARVHVSTADFRPSPDEERKLNELIPKMPWFHKTFTLLQPITTGILGLLLFRNIESFAGPDACPGDTLLWTFGSLRRIADLERLWRIVYIMTVIPIINVLFLFVLLLVAGQTLSLPGNFLPHNVTAFHFHGVGQFLPPFVFITVLIVSTEHTARENPVQAGEEAWGFGQILALVLVGPTLWDVVTVMRDMLKLRREMLMSSSRRLPTFQPTTPLTRRTSVP